MEEKIKELRDDFIKKLSSIEDGVHVKLDYDPEILELIIFWCAMYPYSETNTDCKPIVDEYGNRQKPKTFALPLNILKKIDFSNIDFAGFLVDNYDFSPLYGVNLNPQTVYDKSLTHAIFRGVNFTGPFDDCYINNSDFTGSTGAIINPAKLHGSGSKENGKTIYMRSCKFSGVKFTSPIKHRFLNLGLDGKNCYISYTIYDITKADFTGSTGAEIYTQYLDGGLFGCILNGVTLVDKIDACVTFANFEGAKSKVLNRTLDYVILNPNDLKDRDFTGTNFNGVHFTNPLDKCKLVNTSFKGSKGAVIDLRSQYSLYIPSVDFTDVEEVIGYDGKEMIVSEDGKPCKPLEDKINKFLGIRSENKLVTKKNLEEARKRLIEENKRKVQEKISELLRLVETTERLGVDPKNLYCSIPIGKEELLVQIDDHYEINRNFTEYLRFLNLSMIDFSNVKVSGIDFRGSAARINPQTVYKKDLSNGTFDASNIKFFDDFTGVNIEGADFSECEVDPKEKIK